MFDTNIFNLILDGKVDLSSIVETSELYITHIQKDELSATKDELRREQLLHVFKNITQSPEATSSAVLGVSRIGEAKLGAAKIPTETMIWGLSEWGSSKWGSDGGLYETIKTELDKKNKKKKNNIQDALIAETCILNNFTLVTNDRDLLTVIELLKGHAVDPFTLLGIS